MFVEYLNVLLEREREINGRSKDGEKKKRRNE
jgi:hypothetical protein